MPGGGPGMNGVTPACEILGDLGWGPAIRQEQDGAIATPVIDSALLARGGVDGGGIFRSEDDTQRGPPLLRPRPYAF